VKPTDLIKKAKAENRAALNEAEAKRFLAAYGVPVVHEAVATGPEEAGDKARDLGFPVVLKGMGWKLTHKTERGLVRLGLSSADEVRKAARRMAAAAGKDLEGFLIQPQLSGRREFVAGLFHDDQFGPVVMFGLGGVFTEALGDVVFRLAPMDESHADQMLDELGAKALLGPFRGEKAADRGLLVGALAGLSRIGVEHPEVAEIDVNPLLVTPEGQVAAVDALVVLGQVKPEVRYRPPVEPSAARELFYPKSVAMVGASAQFRKWGQQIFANLAAGGYEGEIYLVNPKAKTIAGRPVYPSVADIPEPVDLAVVTIPAAQVLDLIPQFRAKGIKRVILITSGFAETGPEGRKLEEELVAEARRNDILILGPNTMGVCNPYHKFYCMGSHVRPKPGPTAFIAQSGNMGVQLLSFADRQGIGIRAFGGSGNEAMFTIEDALDAFAVDELTGTVLLYIESVKNGRRFYESARQVSRRKPVVVLKGGRTAAGHKAAATHTGALASNVRVFEAACRQAGIILVDRPMDLLDLSAALSSLPLPKGPRAAIMTLGGGWGVVTADLCNDYGLEVPELSPDLVGRIDRILPPFWSRSNPVDIVGITDPSIPVTIIEELLKWDGCDAVINLGILGRKHLAKRLIESTAKADPDMDPEFLKTVTEMVDKIEADYVEQMARLTEEHHKPILGVRMATSDDDLTVLDVAGREYKAVFFQTPEQAVKALAKMYQYERWLNREGAPSELRERKVFTWPEAGG